MYILLLRGDGTSIKLGNFCRPSVIDLQIQDKDLLSPLLVRNKMLTAPKFLLFSYSKFVLTKHLVKNSNSGLIATFCTALGYLSYRPIATFRTAPCP
jgi:hypothetical protein